MPSLLIGYFPKRRAVRSGWVSPHPQFPEAPFPVGPPVEEICSVAHCISGSPDFSDGGPDCNRWGGYDTPGEARAAVLPDDRAAFEIRACAIVPVLFEEGGETAVDLTEMQSGDVAPLPEAYQRLGYDVVELSRYGDSLCLGCSPLSCNAQAGRVAGVNRYCLMENAADARAVARRFAAEKPEPGPFCVVEVWREGRS